MFLHVRLDSTGHGGSRYKLTNHGLWPVQGGSQTRVAIADADDEENSKYINTQLKYPSSFSSEGHEDKCDYPCVFADDRSWC